MHRLDLLTPRQACPERAEGPALRVRRVRNRPRQLQNAPGFQGNPRGPRALMRVLPGRCCIAAGSLSAQAGSPLSRL
jgi:hypothetical protein